MQMRNGSLKFLEINRDPQQIHAVISLEGNYLPLLSSQLPLPHPAQSSLVSLRLSETPTISDTSLAAQFSLLFLNEHAWKFPSTGTIRILVKSFVDTLTSIPCSG